MNMIDQYIFEVGENLPEKLRADLEKEIRSLIEDTLEERSRTYSRAIDDDMIAEVLKEFGSPERMAASYQPQKYLIGPKLYPTFILVLKIVSSIVLVMALIGLGVEAAQGRNSYSSIFELILHSVGTVFQSLLTVLGNIVFIFAMIERFVPQGIENEKEWDPRSMKQIEEPDKISRFEQGGSFSGLPLPSFYSISTHNCLELVFTRTDSGISILFCQKRSLSMYLH